MKKIIVLLSILSIVSSCTQNDETNRLQAREDIKKAKDLLTQAETQARAGDSNLKKYEDASVLLTAALEKNDRAADLPTEKPAQRSGRWPFDYGYSIFSANHACRRR